MSQEHSFPALPPDVDDFSVLIAWHGPEDKPFYRALLVSPSRVSLITNQPFWNYAVISVKEFAKLVDVLKKQRRHPLIAGSHQPDGAEYYVEIEADQQTYHCSLGFDQATGRVLKQMAAVLEPAHRRPIKDILVRIGQS